MKSLLSGRNLHALIALSSFSLLGVAFYMEYQMGLEPCPLCMLQRIAFFLIGCIAFVSWLTGSANVVRKASAAVVVFGVFGAGLAIRHLYLQSLPAEELPACLPGLSYMVEVFPWQEILSAMLMGTGECGDVLWTFLGLSIPGWTLVAFVGISLINVWLFVTKR